MLASLISVFLLFKFDFMHFSVLFIGVVMIHMGHFLERDRCYDCGHDQGNNPWSNIGLQTH